VEALIAFVVLSHGALATQSAPDEYRELVREFAHAVKVQETRADLKEYKRVLDEDRKPARIARFMDLVDDQRAADPGIVDALVWVSRMAPTWGSSEPLSTTVGDRARMLLVRHHIASERIGLAMPGMMYLEAGSLAAEVLFREALTRSPHRDVRGRACYWLAMYLKNNAELIPELNQPPGALNPRLWLEKRWGKDAVEKLKAADAEKLLKEAEGLFALVVEQYGDVSSFGQTKDDEPLGGEAWKQLHELRDLAVGKPAPDITGEDAGGKGLRLSDYRGRVVLLTFSGDWIDPARAMYPQAREMLKRLGGKQFAILSVNTDREKETLLESIKDGEITWPCWWDGPNRSICAEWNVTQSPTTYVINAAGVIRHKNIRGHALDDAVNALVLAGGR
jgi:peroxiredoxin